MKTYDQYCGLARSLDVLGDRWSMLVIRELAIRECRYTDLRDGLPGIATNLLADRLRSLGEAGLVERREVPPPVASTLYRLTDRGAGLLPALHELVRWATPLMASGPRDGDVERAGWFEFAASSYLRRGIEGGSLTVVFHVDGTDVVVRSEGDQVHVGGDAQMAGGRPVAADLSISGGQWALMGLVSGEISLRDVGRLDDTVAIEGNPSARRRFAELVDRNRAGLEPIGVPGNDAG